MKFILGKKISMTQRFLSDGRVAPVTVVEAGPCAVTQVKTAAKDGYAAVQLGFGQKKNLSKPLQGHLKGLGQFRYLREFRLDESLPLKKGEVIKAEVFQPNDIVEVTGVSKGKGFQGVVRRHHFRGSPASHGHKDQLRMPGSVGPTAPQRVLKGTRMAGHMGASRVTLKNLEVIEVDPVNNLLLIKGAVPGSRGNLLLIAGSGRMNLANQKKVEKNKAAAETKKEEKKSK